LSHQDHGNPDAQFPGHRDDGDPGGPIRRMPLGHRAEKVAQLGVLADRRPGGLDELGALAQ